MFTQKKEKALEDLSPASIEADRKQKSLNRVFGLLTVVAVLLLAMFVYEIVLLVR